MTDRGINKLILASALDAEMQGMIAENKTREINGSADRDFYAGYKAALNDKQQKNGKKN